MPGCGKSTVGRHLARQLVQYLYGFAAIGLKAFNHLLPIQQLLALFLERFNLGYLLVQFRILVRQKSITLFLVRYLGADKQVGKHHDSSTDHNRHGR